MTGDWVDTTIGELAVVTRGASPRPISSDRWFDDAGKVGWIRIADVNRSNGRELKVTSQRLSEDGILRSRFLDSGTLILSIAASVGIPVITQIPACIHDGFVALTSVNADQKFMFYLLKAAEGRLREAGQSGSQMNINSDIVRGLPVKIPADFAEQKAISSALWEKDDLISSLERLISKKQAIKQGMMQELLTGRTRLQGFSKSWQATTFGDLVRIQRGSVLTRAQAGSGRIPVVAGGKTPAGYTDKANRVGRTITISASGASAGYVALYNEPIFASDCSTISSSRHYDLDFIYYSLLLRQDDIYRAQTGGAQPHIHACDVYPMEIRVPTDMQEQIAIAQVLVDADKEIMALERRLESARGIKQGMMQELLTGRTKLVPEGVR